MRVALLTFNVKRVEVIELGVPPSGECGRPPYAEAERGRRPTTRVSNHSGRSQMLRKRTGLLWPARVSGAFGGMGLSYFDRMRWLVGP